MAAWKDGEGGCYRNGANDDGVDSSTVGSCEICEMKHPRRVGNSAGMVGIIKSGCGLNNDVDQLWCNNNLLLNLSAGDCSSDIRVGKGQRL